MTLPQFQNIRAQPSQRDSFETLCKVFASAEPPTSAARFVSVGLQDSGVECYWKLPDGAIHGWQAKFFLSALQASQWKQIDESITTARRNHPGLTRMTICLPRDLADPSGSKKSERKVWEARVAKWQDDTEEGESGCEFVLWDSTELLKRLTRKENAGLVEFFFGQEILEEAACAKHLRTQIRAAGPRYHPELNVDTRTGILLRCIRDPSAFADKWHEALRHARKAMDRVHLRGFGLRPEPESTLTREYDALGSLFHVDLKPKVESVWLQTALKTAQESIAQLNAIADLVESASSEAPAAPTEASAAHERVKLPSEQENRDSQERLRSAARWISEALASLQSAADYAQSLEAELAAGKPLLLTGEGGSGKTHALLDLAEGHAKTGGLSLVFFGAEFDRPDALACINTSLDGRFATLREFVGAANAAGAARERPTLLIIDAINESLVQASVIKAVENVVELVPAHPWVRLVISHRTPFLADNPYPLPKNSIARAEHYGFEGNDADALIRFAEYYKLPVTTPGLAPEFRNPLFLHLFCRVVAAQPGKPFEPGARSLSAIFREVLVETQRSIAQHTQTGLDPKGDQVRLALEGIAAIMLERGATVAERGSAKAAVDRVHPPAGHAFEWTLFAQLLSQRLILERRMVDDEGVVRQGVSLGWERFSDLLCAELLLRDLATAEAVQAASREGERIHRAIVTSVTVYRSSGLAVALTILIAERLGVELPTLLPSDIHITDAQYLESVRWRDKVAIPDSLAERIFQAALQPKSHQDALRLVLEMATVDAHPLNAACLHRRLLPLSMAERDIAWTIPVNRLVVNDEHSAVESLIRSCWRREERRSPIAGEFLPENAYLACVTLLWLCSLPARWVRDRATKAVVEVLSEHPALAERLVQDFSGVDDPYVRERLAAALLGAATLQPSAEGLRPFAASLPVLAMSEARYPSSILLRHYLGQAASYIRARLGDDSVESLLFVRKPLLEEPVSLEAAKALRPREHSSWRAIVFSVCDDDFSRYVLSLPRSDEPIRPIAKVEVLTPELVRGSQFAARWILQRIIQFSPPLAEFDEFDDALRSHGRMDHAQERLGKKYQWIAWRELLASLDDSYTIPQSRWSEPTWLSHARIDIDPTLTIRAPVADAWEHQTAVWWRPVTYQHDPRKTHEEWIATYEDIPDIRSCLMPVRPTDRREWIALSGYYEWDQIPPPELTRSEFDGRRIFLMCHAYIVRASDQPKFVRWASKKNFWGRWFSERASLDGFFGELPVLQKPGRSELLVSAGSEEHESPVNIEPLASELVAGGGHDLSTEKEFTIHTSPSWLMGELGITWGTGDGAFLTSDGRTVIFDPGVVEQGPGAPLVCRETLCRWLRANDAALVWTCLGEKLVRRVGSESSYHLTQISGVFWLDMSVESVEGGLRARVFDRETMSGGGGGSIEDDF